MNAIETAHERFAQREQQRKQQARETAAFLIAGPHEPMATLAQVLEVPCPSCGVPSEASCDTTGTRLSLVGMVFQGMSSIHLRRYLDRTHDPR